MFIWYKQCFLRLTKLQVAFSIYVLFTFAPYAGAGTRLATQKQALLWRSCFNCVKTNPSNEGFVFTSQKLVLLRRPRFLCFAKEKEAKERRLRAQVWLRQTSLTLHSFSGAKKNWISCNFRLRRFEHASPYSQKNRAPFGCASRGEIDPTVCIYSELNLNQYSVASPCRTICTVCGSSPCPDLNLIHYKLLRSLIDNKGEG